jgi:pimeloyl-ACP methyl ester carboxylesterase
MTIADGRTQDGLTDSFVTLPDGRPRLAVRRGVPGSSGGDALTPGRPFLLVHGLASNARLWDGVAERLLAAGHPVTAVDQRGHGRSPEPASGYDTGTCADDLAALIDVEGFTGSRAPLVIGQSWGGNVVLSLAARYPGAVAAVGCVDGGWIRLHDRFASFEECWVALAPPRLDHARFDEVQDWISSAHPDWPEQGVLGTLANLVELPDGGVRARLSRDHHADIVRSLFEGDPMELYPRVQVPVLLVPATGPEPTAEEAAEPTSMDARRQANTRRSVGEALSALPDARVRWYPGADHDLHAQHPDRLARDLLEFAASLPTGPADTREVAR